MGKIDVVSQSINFKVHADCMLQHMAMAYVDRTIFLYRSIFEISVWLGVDMIMD